MSTFRDQVSALRMRDLIRKLIHEELAKLRPPYKYGVVTEIDAPNQRAMVLYPEDTEPTSVAFGIIAVPTTIGQRVRIEGRPGDRYISDVLDNP